MLPTDFGFELPTELVAQQPPPHRTDSRLLVMGRSSGTLADAAITDFPSLVDPRDLIVFNDTRVVRARLRGKKASGGQVEVLVDRILDDQRVLAQVKASRAPKAGTELELTGGVGFTVLGRQGRLYELKTSTDLLPYLAQHGEVPLPPYIKRAADDDDAARYQTVFARRPGAVAAPTAGLHFDQSLLQALADRGADIQYVTLHVGAGTFLPVKVDDIRDHKMHSERGSMSATAAAEINATRAKGGRIIPVGTTALRLIETAAEDHGSLSLWEGATDIFITPGYGFRISDGLITNFHLPKSTLMMLVSALMGADVVREIYAHAIENSYRFFSYGDASLLLPKD